MSAERILVVDDEANIVELCRMYLEQDGFQVDRAGDGEKALQQVAARQPDLVVLDVMLPKLDGFEVCRQLRAASDVPILMLTARTDDVDKIVGLELGADDYLTKPFNPRELVARVKAILRRRGPAEPSDGPLRLGDLEIDPARREVRIASQPAELRTKEFDLLLAFARNSGLVLSRDRLLEIVWGYEYPGQTRTVDVHVSQLRKYLKPSGSVRIETVTGVGYKLVEG
jgi:DNA-binding response OmpR family regulator